LTAGTYSVFVTDVTGCAYNEDITILAENKFNVQTQITGSTCGLNNAVVRVIKSSGGTSPFDYVIDNKEMTRLEQCNAVHEIIKEILV
jgi:ribosome maturation factor RimP